MDIALTLRDAGYIIIGVGIIILLLYCIIFMKHLVTSVKHTNKILEDAQIVSKIAANKSVEIDKIINDAAHSVSNVTDILKGNRSPIAVFSSIINAIMSIKKNKK